jgi:hypothetical protein
MEILQLLSFYHVLHDFSTEKMIRSEFGTAFLLRLRHLCAIMLLIKTRI